MDNNARKMLGLTDENIYFSENWLEEIERKGRKAYLIKGELSYVPLSCEKCGIKNQGEVVKNGTKTTQTQIPLFKSSLTYLELNVHDFFVMLVKVLSLHKRLLLLVLTIWPKN